MESPVINPLSSSGTTSTTTTTTQSHRADRDMDDSTIHQDSPKQKLNKTILKEFRDTNYQSFSEGQIQMVFPDEENLCKVHVLLAPTEGPYAGGRVMFHITLPVDYPHSKPTVKCASNIVHPNIDPKTGKVCFNILSDEWDSCLRLADYAHALLWLLYHPNLDSRLNPDCPAHWHQFLALVKSMISYMNVQFQPCQPVPIEPLTVRELAERFTRLMTREENSPDDQRASHTSISAGPVRFVAGARVFSS